MGNKHGKNGGSPASPASPATPNADAANKVANQSPEEIEEQALRDAFSVYDKNHDNVIQKDELAGALESFYGRKPTDLQLAKIMTKVDLNDDGVIDYAEFVRMMNARKNTKGSVQNAFDGYDANKDGYITKEELSEVLNQVEPTGADEIDEILALADLDNDGRINIEEFMAFFM